MKFNKFKHLHEKFSNGTERNGTLLGRTALPLGQGVRPKNWKKTKQNSKNTKVVNYSPLLKSLILSQF
jgi:hypothetical protein